MKTWKTASGFTWALLALLSLAGCGHQGSGPGVSPEPGSVRPPIAPATLERLPEPQGHSFGAGSSGGGHGLTEKGKLMLRDLVEGQTCTWIDGPHFFKTYLPVKSELDRDEVMLQKEPIGYLFYFLLQDRALLRAYYEETINLNVCLSKNPLRTLPENIDESIASYNTSDIDKKSEHPTQIAIRIGDDLFIDQKAYASLDSLNQEYLQLHEIMHSFIPMGTPARMTRLRDFIAGVRALDLKFPRRPGGAYDYRLGKDFSDLLRSVGQEYELLKENSHVSFVPSGKTTVLGLVDRYLLLGDLAALKVVFEKHSLQPMMRGPTGHTLFDDLIYLISDCQTADTRPYCQNALPLLGFYLDNGGDPDFMYTTGEWRPMPVWEYFLFSMNRSGREPRLVFAKTLFERLVTNSGGRTPRLQARLNHVLLQLCYDNFLGDSVNEVLNWGADVNARDEKGKTPLIIAVEKKGNGNNLYYGYPATYLVGILRVHGADLSVKNPEGKTALQIMKDFKKPLFGIYDNDKRYYLGVKALEVKSIDEVRPEFKALGMELPVL